MLGVITSSNPRARYLKKKKTANSERNSVNAGQIGQMPCVNQTLKSSCCQSLSPLLKMMIVAMTTISLSLSGTILVTMNQFIMYDCYYDQYYCYYHHNE